LPATSAVTAMATPWSAWSWMLPSHSSCLTVNVRGPAVNLVFSIAAAMLGHSMLMGSSECSKPVRSLHDFGRLKSEHCRVRRKTEEHPADRLIMRLAALRLLRGGMHVAKAALERGRSSKIAVAPAPW